MTDHGHCRFEVFKGRHTPPPALPLASITAANTLRLNRPALELLGSPARVRLLLDRHKRVIGIRAADVADPDELRCSYVVGNGGSGAGVISTRALLAELAEPAGTNRRRRPFLVKDTLCVRLDGEEQP